MRLNAKRLISLLGGKELFIPKDGWNHGSFAKYGHPMLVTLHRTAQVVQKQQGAELARGLKRILMQQVKEVIARAQHMHRAGSRSMKATIYVSNEHLWLDALQQVIRENNLALSAEIVPTIQSTLAQGYSRTGILLGQQPNPAAGVPLQHRANEQAIKLSKLDIVTQERIGNAITKAHVSADTLTDVAAKVFDIMDGETGARAMTIARTETSRAWTAGSIQSFKECPGLTHVSVIGCTSREEQNWDKPWYQQFMYDGESTCNIQDVPLHDADMLNFHPNHTGTMVPSRFD